MEKSVIITIMVDNVPLGKLEAILRDIDNILEGFDNKRVTTNLVDERLVMRP